MANGKTQNGQKRVSSKVENLHGIGTGHWASSAAERVRFGNIYYLSSRSDE